MRPATALTVGMAVCILVAGVVAAGPHPMPIFFRAGGVFSALLAIVLGWHLIGRIPGPHAVYYLRSADGAVRYVGITDDFERRLDEHVGDDEPWKRQIVAGNCTVARFCLTRIGARMSERHRITAINRAARRGRCPELHNDQHADSKTTALAAWWCRLESVLVEDACWHRPVVLVAAEPEPEPVREQVRAHRRQVRSTHGGGDVADDQAGDDNDDGFAEAWAEIVAGWDNEAPEPDFHGSAKAADSGVPPTTWVESPGGSNIPHLVEESTNQTPTDADPPSPADSPVNADSSTGGGQSAPDGADSAGGGAQGRSKTCVEDGCGEPVLRYRRCAVHARKWDRERKRKKREDG